MSDPQHRRPPPPRQQGSGGSFRPDIEGLRAVAVGGVLLYHAGVPSFSGGYVGVDVFFVISGFLITGLLLHELSTTGDVRLGRFFARRVKRLLPLALLVLVVVAVLAAWLSDPVARPSVGGDVAASGVYVMNWRLALESVDYSAAGLDASPLQHYWTLGVEEQFYLVWPALMLAAALGWRRRGGRLRPALAVVFAVVGVASFVYADRLTAQAADVAYFSTFARGWELALGALLALVLSRPSRQPALPRVVRLLAGAGGLVAIVASMAAYDDTTLFPGPTALLPTLGVAAVILAGSGDTGSLVQRLLSWRPMRHVGRVSYAWYLWHWPLLVFAGTVWGPLSTTQGLLVVAASYVPTVLSHHWVEQPLHHSRARWTRPVAAVPLGLAASVIAVAVGVALSATTPTVPLASDSQAQGARVLPQAKVPQPSAPALRPEPKDALDDLADVHERCLILHNDTEIPDDCVVGKPSSSATVVLFGDSHALQYAGGLRRVARDQGWRLVLLGKSSCPPADVTTFDRTLRREYDECDRWRQEALRRIAQERPDLLVTASNTGYEVVRDGTRLSRERSADALAQGYRRLLSQVRNVERVAVLTDHPHMGDAAACVAENQKDLDTCARPRSEVTKSPALARRVARQVDNARLLDAMPQFCSDDVCPAVIGNVVVYRPGNHLTSTYIQTMVPWLRRELSALV